jgi:hypothetical protein
MKKIIIFVENNYDKFNIYRKKVNTKILKAEIFKSDNNINVSFPIMRELKIENKIFNQDIKNESLKIFYKFFKDINQIINDKNFKYTIHKNEGILSCKINFCLFKGNKNYVFSVIKIKNSIKFISNGKEISLKDLKEKILERLFGSEISNIYKLKNNNNLSVEEINLIKILLI